MKTSRFFKIIILGALVVFGALPQLVLADAISDACHNAGDGYLPASTITEYIAGDFVDPRDDKCGVSGNTVDCPGATKYGLPETPINVACCKRTQGTTDEFACVRVSGATAGAGGEQDDTKVVIADPFSAPPPAEPVYFTPQVGIPGEIIIGGKRFTISPDEKIVVTPSTAANYFALFYRFFVAALAVIAVVMVMWGGFKRVMAAGAQEKITDANDTIFSALSGLVIALVSYSLLSLVNPDLVNLKPLTAITPISRVDFTLDAQESSEDIPSQGSVNGIFPTIITGDNIVNPNGYQADLYVALALKSVASKLKEQGITLVIASGLRSEAKQRELIAQNCKEPESANAGKCVPKPGRPDTCYLKNGPTSCPHTTGKAVDVWAAIGNINPISQDDCMKNKTACRQNQAMATMGKAMVEAGFCSLASEPWHFEKPWMSSSCKGVY